MVRNPLQRHLKMKKKFYLAYADYSIFSDIWLFHHAFIETELRISRLCPDRKGRLHELWDKE